MIRPLVTEEENCSVKQNKSLISLLIVLIVYSFLVITFHHYERLTGDSTLYFSIAEKYIEGDLENAINGYWGPLLSWLLIPFLYFGSTHLFAINALNLIFGLITITGVWKLSFRFDMTDSLRAVLLLPLIPVCYYISIIQPMDFLLLAVLVYYLSIVFKEDYSGNLSNGIRCGILGSLAYFSKPYGLPFFVSHFLLINVCHYLRDSSGQQRRKVLKNCIAGLVIFFMLSGIWIALISNKYGHITFSNMSRGVFASLGPDSEHDTLEKGDPIFFEGFFEPPNETAFIIYEDPSYARKKTWSPLESLGLYEHFINNVSKNLIEAVRLFESFSRLSIIIVVIYFLSLATVPLSVLFTRRELLYPFLTVMLYTAGYLPFHYEQRYLWVVNILLLLMGGGILGSLFRSEFFHRKARKNILIIILLLSFSISPVKSITEVKANNINREMHDLGLKINSLYDIRGNIASNRQKKRSVIHDSWHRTFRLAYWTQSRYYGQARENIGDKELERELKKYDIDYYFYWDSVEPVPGFLSRYKEITGEEIPGLKIYSLKEKKSFIERIKPNIY